MPGIKLNFYSILEHFIDVIKIGLPIFIINIRHRLKLVLIGTCQIDFAINLLIYYHILKNVLIS